MDCEEERLKYFKNYNIVYASIFAIYIFANSIMAHACVCGAVCQNGIQGVNTKIFFQFHNRCSVGQCESCDIEDAQTVKAPNSSPSKLSIELFCTNYRIIYSSDFQPDKNSIHISCDPIFDFSKSAYLENSALLL